MRISEREALYKTKADENALGIKVGTERYKTSTDSCSIRDLLRWRWLLSYTTVFFNLSS